jgi:hypothetical protein
LDIPEALTQRNKREKIPMGERKKKKKTSVEVAGTHSESNFSFSFYYKVPFHF